MSPAAILALSGTFVASLMMCRISVNLLISLGAVDQPGVRRSHVVPTPRGGGLGLVLAWAGLLVWLGFEGEGGFHWIVLSLSVLALALLGLWDDLRDVPARVRLALQAVIAGVALLLLWPPMLDLGAWTFVAQGAWAPLLLLVLLAAVNFFNFMDGINGMASLQALFGGCLLGAVALAAGDQPLAIACFGVAAASCGFLPWNFPRARVFMGDAGSTSLGLAFALLGVIGAAREVWSLLLPALVMSLFIVDALVTVLVRIARGERWYTAHREHAYQRLVIRGWPHHRVSMLYAGLNVAVVAPVVWLTRDSGTIQPLAGIALWIILATLWWVARRS